MLHEKVVVHKVKEGMKTLKNEAQSRCRNVSIFLISSQNEGKCPFFKRASHKACLCGQPQQQL